MQDFRAMANVNGQLQLTNSTAQQEGSARICEICSSLGCKERLCVSGASGFVLGRQPKTTVVARPRFGSV